MAKPSVEGGDTGGMNHRGHAWTLVVGRLSMSVDLRSIWKLGRGGDVAEESWPADRGTEGQGAAWGGGQGQQCLSCT